MTQTEVLVTGASGFIGSNLCQALDDAGHHVRAMTRRPDSYTGAGAPVAGDVSDEASLTEPLAAVDVAYYLVHSLDSADFEARDAAAARSFGSAAARAGVRRIVYLGGLGAEDEQLSPHLRSRREVEHCLAEAGVPVTVLRAAVVIGHGGISWEITRQLVDHLPMMIAPRWVSTRTQPIALTDVVRYLVGVLDAPAAEGAVYEIGGPEVLRYIDMLRRAARIQNKRTLPVVAVPLLTPRLSSAWLALVTDVNLATARNLVDSMTTEVVVRDTTIRDLVPGDVLGYDDSVRAALADRAAEQHPEADMSKAR
ncbi:NAD(P)H-binding protein [Jatrophihabitans lederbergiae]|uniref:NAD(P)H-binding protein n=1 Tax=Jatrophihabitans lederbergiae TaxID=3075547 RepID=A0ABU2JBQ3_9ACTN|nr:NAD(P)H-binding protein [Jatrophihabitans sp. DSM 44399]MDT0262412.1 NAD(P)H-binding protein [Jatrophihabitans sp. DSM 44399]